MPLSRLGLENKYFRIDWSFGKMSKLQFVDIIAKNSFIFANFANMQKSLFMPNSTVYLFNSNEKGGGPVA